MFEEMVIPSWVLVLLVIVGIWEVVWKGIGLWVSAENKHKGWFIAILIVNSIGILPLIYLVFFEKASGKKKK